MKVVGIDIGGTKTAMALFDGERQLESIVEPTSGFEPTIRRIIEWCQARNPEAVGVGCPGPLDEERGVVKNRDTLDGWFDMPIKSRLREALSVPVNLVNDADAALLGELWQGSLRDSSKEPALMLTFGTGVGGAFWDGKHRLIGADGEHPEIGHVLVRSAGRPCYCGLNGCLESEASGTALNLQAEEAGFMDLAQMVESGAAASVFSRARAALDVAFRIFAHVYRPATILLGGGMIASFGDEMIRENKLTQNDAPMLLSPMRILRAKLGPDAGVFGAAAIAHGVLC